MADDNESQKEQEEETKMKEDVEENKLDSDD